MAAAQPFSILTGLGSANAPPTSPISSSVGAMADDAPEGGLAGEALRIDAQSLGLCTCM